MLQVQFWHTKVRSSMLSTLLLSEDLDYHFCSSSHHTHHPIQILRSLHSIHCIRQQSLSKEPLVLFYVRTLHTISSELCLACYALSYLQDLWRFYIFSRSIKSLRHSFWASNPVRSFVVLCPTQSMDQEARPTSAHRRIELLCSNLAQKCQREFYWVRKLYGLVYFEHFLSEQDICQR